MEEELPFLSSYETKHIHSSFNGIFMPNEKLLSARVRRSRCGQFNVIISEWRFRNLQKGTWAKLRRYFLTNKDYTDCKLIGTADISHWVQHAASPSENFKAVICVALCGDSKTELRQYLEIWHPHGIYFTADLNAKNLHGLVYIDHCFSSMSWSPDESMLVYVAEKKPSNIEPLLKEFDTEDDGSTGGLLYHYDENWGETITPRRQPVIVFFDIYTKHLSIVQGIPEDISPGQVIFTPDSGGLVGVGFSNKPRRLGPMYCTNKRNHIFYLAFDGDPSLNEYRVLSSEDVTVHSPRFSPDGKFLVWMERPIEGPTHASHRIIKYHWRTNVKTILVDIVDRGRITENGRLFNGIYSGALDKGFVGQCFDRNSKFLYFSTEQKFCIKTFAVQMSTGRIWDVSAKEPNLSTILLETSTIDDNALFALTSFEQPDLLATSNVSLSRHYWPPLLLPLFKYSNLISPNITHSFPVTSMSESGGNCFATYYGPSIDTKKSLGTIVYLHGGPHLSVPSVHTPHFDFFVKTGFAVLIVHYRGTAGFGERFLQSLVGNMGTFDVADCHTALRIALQKFNWLNPNKVVIFGESSAGPLASRLTRRFPNVFKAVVLRNPIVDVYLGSFLSDNPDWGVVEFGYNYTGLENIPRDPELVQKMTELSALLNIKKVEAPTLLLLGKKDVRVPAALGIAYYNILKEMGVPVKALLYDDFHHLHKVTVELDYMINSVVWFKRAFLKVTRSAPADH